MSSLDIISIYSRTLEKGLYHPKFSSIFKSTVLKFASQDLQGESWKGIASYMHVNLLLPDEVSKDKLELQKFKSKIAEINTVTKSIKEYNRDGLLIEPQKYMRNLSHIISQVSFESMLY